MRISHDTLSELVSSGHHSARRAEREWLTLIPFVATDVELSIVWDLLTDTVSTSLTFIV